MFSSPYPDLAASLRLQSQTTSLRAQLDIAGKETTTGLSADIAARTGGNLAPVFGIDAALQRLDQNVKDLSLAQARAGAAQTALGLVEEGSGALGLNLLSAIDTGDAIARSTYIAEADVVLGTIIGALNTQFAGRALFSGAAEDSVSLQDVETLKADIAALVAGAPDPASAQSAVDAYFAPGGGFETNIYGGSNVDAAGAQVSDETRLAYLPRADAAALRDVLKAVTLVATSDAAPFSGDPVARDAYLSEAAGNLIAVRDEITNLRAALGVAEQQIGDASDRNLSEQNALKLSRNDLVGVDQFTAAARFVDLEGQLQSLYTVTSRLSSLSLTNFLR
ncbi:flagellin [Oceanibium sediminis]|uniref:flagellin n=1 Tax=Oceanibium sediminis TaxID=2026339 RepID=UPI000DD30CDF|nr:flagellin [Oceanibium sediminis]